MADIRKKQLTVERIISAMFSKDFDPVDNWFDENYYGEFGDVDMDEFHQFIVKNDSALTRKIVKSIPGEFCDWEDCLQYAPSIKNDPDMYGFERDVLEMWVKFLFTKPGLMNELARVIAETNPDADRDVINMMIEYSGGIEPTFISTGDGALGGMTVVFTGKSKYFIGEDMEDFLRKNGAKTSHSVSKNVDLLLIGEKPSAGKISKAYELGITILHEEDLYSRNSTILKDCPAIR